MRRIVVSVFALALLGLTPGARATGVTETCSWAVDGFPFGPNVVADGSGNRLELSGDGTFAFDGRSADGGGRYRLTTAAGALISAGMWEVRGLDSYEDQGALVPAPDVFRRGVVVLDVSFGMLGHGTMTVFCHAEPGDVEGATVRIERDRFDSIVAGSTTLARDGGLWAALTEAGAIVPV